MGLLKMLLTGEDEDLDIVAMENEASIWEEDTVDLFAVDSVSTPQSLLAYDPERAADVAPEREAAEARERDEIVARVGNLFFAVESLLRLLKNKGMINDLDLHRMEQQVDREDGLEDGEGHPDSSPVPSHCPKCEVRIPAGKRRC